MKTHLARRILFATAGLALAASFPVEAMADAKETIEDRLQQYEARFNEGDAKAISELFAADVTYYGPLGRIYQGREAVRQRYQGSLDAGFSDMKVEPLDIRVFGDTAYDIARYTITDPSGKPLTGYHLAILANEDGEWIVQRTLVNAKMPVPKGE
jgi:uncharacterized protein (TIGR02246 family)